MKRWLHLSLTLAILYPLSAIHCLSSENGIVFLSLTRKAESMENMPTNVSIVSPAEIRDRNARTLGELLTDEVGLDKGQYGTLGGQTNLMFRGSTSEQVLVMIDGRRINDIAMGAVDINNIPADSIERIEIIRGGASAIYGTGAFGAAVNIITKKPESDTPVTNFLYSGSSFNTQSFHFDLGVKKEKTSALVAAGKTISDGWRQNSDYDSNSFFTRFGYDAGTLGQFDLSGSFARSDTGVPGTGVSLDKYDGTVEKMASSPRARQGTSKEYIRLENAKPVGESSLKTILYTSADKVSFKDPDNMFGAINDEYNSFVVGTELQYITEYGLTAGYEWWQEQFKQKNLIDSTNTIDRARLAYAGYLQQEVTYHKVTVIPNIRYDDYSAFGGVFSPRISVVFQANDSWKLSANSGKAWRAPTFNDLYYPLSGNQNLKPEEGITSDIGAQYSTRTVKASLTLFLTETKNLIQWAPDATGMWLPSNIGRSRQQGIEAAVNHKLADGLYHRLNYTYLFAEDLEAAKIMFYRPCNKINYELSYLTALNTKVILNAEYVSSQETGDAFPPIVSQLPEYATAGIKVAQKISGAELWVRADNITDTRYQTRLEYPLPGRTFSAGINMQFN